VRVVSRLRQAFGVEVAVRALFTSPTVAGLAEQVRRAEASRAPALVAVAGREPVLSFAQQRLWFLDQFEPGSAEYNVPFALRLRGELDEGALRRALEGVVARHQVLRTSFGAVRGEPLVEVHEAVEAPFEVLEVASEEEARQRAAEWPGSPSS